MPNSTYEFWRDAALAGTYTPLSPERLEEMYTATVRAGSGNGWTGSSAVLAAMVRELLREVEWLRATAPKSEVLITRRACHMIPKCPVCGRKGEVCGAVYRCKLGHLFDDDVSEGGDYFADPSRRLELQEEMAQARRDNLARRSVAQSGFRMPRR